jgi:hypothetical protein
MYKYKAPRVVIGRLAAAHPERLPLLALESCSQASPQGRLRRSHGVLLAMVPELYGVR